MKIFDNVAQLRLARLGTGQLVKTKGYYTANDGGGAEYIIVATGTGTDDGGSYLDLALNQAELIENKNITILQYGAIADGITDIHNSAQAMIAKTNTCIIPDGNFLLSTPLTSVQSLLLSGSDIVLFDRARGAIISAPNGLLINTLATRHRVTVKSISAVGQGRAVAGVKCIEGQFGGDVVGNVFEGYDVIYENPFSFLTDIKDNHFLDANIALYISTANEVNVEGNFFGSDVVKPIDTYNLTPFASGTNACFPLTVNRNNFNLGTNSIPSVLSGQVVFTENYLEFFSAATVTHAVDYVAMRFANGTLNISDNHINGQTNIAHCFHIYSDNASGAEIKGEITRNYMRGFNAQAIEIGNKAGFFDEVIGIDIKQNNVSFFPYVKYQASEFSVPPQQFQMQYTAGTLDVSGASYVRIPFALSSGFNTVDVTDGRYNCRQEGLYEIEVSFTALFTADLRTFQHRFEVNGVGANEGFSSLNIGSAGSNYRTVTQKLLVYLSISDDVEYVCRNGETINSGYMFIRKIDEPLKYTGV
jgi:hypothetical protein